MTNHHLPGTVPVLKPCIPPDLSIQGKMRELITLPHLSMGSLTVVGWSQRVGSEGESRTGVLCLDSFHLSPIDIRGEPVENVWATLFYLKAFPSISSKVWVFFCVPTPGTHNVLHAKQILQQSLKLICFEITWNIVKKKYMGNNLDLIYKMYYFGNCSKSLTKGDTSVI